MALRHQASNRLRRLCLWGLLFLFLSPFTDAASPSTPASTSASLPSPSCVFSTPAGTFDLAPLGAVRADSPQDGGAGWSALFGACADLDASAAEGLCVSAAPAPAPAPAPALLAEGGACHALGRLAQRSVAPLAANSSGRRRVGVTVAFGGGDACGRDAVARSISIDVVCADVAHARAMRLAEDGAGRACTVAASVESRAGCPLECARDMVPEWVSTLRREGGAAALVAEAEAKAALPENSRWTAITAASNEYATMSHSQDREDVWAFERFFWQKRGGVVLESGAEDGLHASNSLFLQNFLLWHSILIEPGPTNFELLKRNREDGCLLLHAAICDRPRTVHFVEFLAVGGIVEFMAASFLKEWWPKINVSQLESLPEVPCWPLASLLEPFGITHVDLWSLDTEGAELAILNTVDWTRFRADIVVIEDTQLERKEAKTDLMQKAGYVKLGRLANNLWFRHADFVPQTKPGVNVSSGWSS